MRPVAGYYYNKELLGKVREEDMTEWAKKELGDHEHPRLVEFRDELLKNLAVR